MYSSYGYSSSYDSGISPALMTVSLIIALALALVTLIAVCKIYSKANTPWGFLFIPIYGTYCQYQIADCTGLFWGNLVVGLLSLLFPPIALVSIILHILFCCNLARAFGKGGGFAFGLIVLPILFIWILGFGSAEYKVGQPSTQPAATTKYWKCPQCGMSNVATRCTCKNCNYVH